MEKAFQMGKVSATGSFHLFIGKVLSTVILAVGTILLTRLMLPEEYGLYAIAFIPAQMITLFQDWGIGSAMIKYVAHYRAADQPQKIHDIIASGVTFKTITGVALSALALLLAHFTASTVFHRPESTPLIAIGGLTILANALLTTAQSTFIGYEKMQLNSLTLICQSILKTIAAPLLVFLGYSVLGAVIGYALSFLAAGLIAIALLYVLLLRNHQPNPPQPNKTQTLKQLLHYGVPLSLSNLLLGFRMQFYSFMMAFFCTDVMIGNYHAAANFGTLLTFFTFPISTVLFPAFAKLDPKKEHQILQTVFTSSVKYTALLLVPATMAIMVLSKPMIYTLFGGQYASAPLFLTLYVITNLFAVSGSLSMGTLLVGVGETTMLLKLNLLTVAFGVPLAFLFIPTLGIIGVILGSTIAILPRIIWGLHWIWKHYETKADFTSSTKIVLASTIAALLAYLPIYFLNTPEWTQLILGGTIFLSTYILTAPIIGAIHLTEIKNLRTMLSGLGIISKILNVPLDLAEKITLRS